MSKNAENSPGSREGSIDLDPRRLKGLAHPLRMRILGTLREFGPATASALAERLGESSGATSYHLRQLAGFGFVEEAEGRGSRRERWWRASHRSSRFDEALLAGDIETRLAGAEFLKAAADGASQRTLAWIDALPAVPKEWAEAGTVSDWGLSLTPAEAAALKADIETLVSRYRSHDPEAEPDPDRSFVAFQVQILPRLPGGGA
jgi:DNA-binding transcriptional ArsR family regulator